jgi:hypothetical protein
MEKEHFIKFDIIETGIYSIECKNLGKIGYLKLNDKNGFFYFLPEKHFFYSGLHLAIILNKMNELNNYKKERTNV